MLSCRVREMVLMSIIEITHFGTGFFSVVYKLKQVLQNSKLIFEHNQPSEYMKIWNEKSFSQSILHPYNFTMLLLQCLN